MIRTTIVLANFFRNIKHISIIIVFYAYLFIFIQTHFLSVTLSFKFINFFRINNFNILSCLGFGSRLIFDHKCRLYNTLCLILILQFLFDDKHFFIKLQFDFLKNKIWSLFKICCTPSFTIFLSLTVVPFLVLLRVS